MIRWTEEALEAVHAGRGLHRPLPDAPAKPPSLTKQFNDAAKGWQKTKWSDPSLDGPAEPVFARLQQTFGATGKAAAQAELDATVQGLAFRLEATHPRYPPPRSPTTTKLVRLWVARHGAAFAVEAYVASWTFQATFEQRRYGTPMTNLQVRHGQLACPDGLAKPGRGDAEAAALRELRALLSQVDDESYAHAVAAARPYCAAAPASFRAVIAYLLPTEHDLARSAFEAGVDTPWRPLAAHSVADPDLLCEATRNDPGWNADRWVWPLLGTLGDAALDPIIDLYGHVGPGPQQTALLPVLATFGDPRVAEHLAAAESSELRTAYFLREPHLAIDHLDGDDALRAMVLRASPELDPNAVPRASDDELPEPLRIARTIKSKKALPSCWQPVADLLLTGRQRALDPAAFERLGLLLRAHDGRLTPETQAVRDALDPQSSDAFGVALLESLGHQTSGENRFVQRSAMVFGHDGVVDLLAAQVQKASYNDGVAFLQILTEIATDRALLRVSHIANKGRGGIKRAAQGQLATLAKRRGLSRAELDDRLVPDLGLDASGRLSLDYGPRSFTVGFDEALRPFVRDDKSKPRKSLPKPGVKDDPELAPAAYERFKTLKKTVRALASVQIARFEAALQDQRRWPVADWNTYVARHPLLTHVAQRLLWGTFDGDGTLTSTFRLDDSQERVDARDEPSTTEADHIGLVHPLQLTDEVKGAWGAVFADYGLVQPFPQLGRSTYRMDTPEATALWAALEAGWVAPGARAMGLLSKGWERGPVEDAGQWYSVWRTLGPLTLTIELSEGVNIGGYYGGDIDQTFTATVKTSTHAGPIDPVLYSEALLALDQLRQA